MIGYIKNIRFTYQWGIARYSTVQGKWVGIPGGSAAMRRPKRVPLLHFRTELGACHACHHSPYRLGRHASGPRAGAPCRPCAAWPQADRREGQEPPRRDASRRARRSHAGGHWAQPQRSARRLRAAAVARPERRAGAPRSRPARQTVANAIELRAGRNGFVGTVWDVTGAVPPLIDRRSELVCFGRSSHRPMFGMAVSPPAFRMLRPPPPGGRIFFFQSLLPERDVFRNRIPPRRHHALTCDWNTRFGDHSEGSGADANLPQGPVRARAGLARRDAGAGADRIRPAGRRLCPLHGAVRRSRGMFGALRPRRTLPG